MTEDAAMQHLRSPGPQGASGRAAEVPSGVDRPGLEMVGNDLRTAAESDGERVEVCARPTGSSLADASRQASLQDLPGGYQRAGEP